MLAVNVTTAFITAHKAVLANLADIVEDEELEDVLVKVCVIVCDIVIVCESADSLCMLIDRNSERDCVFSLRSARVGHPASLAWSSSGLLSGHARALLIDWLHTILLNHIVLLYRRV